MRKSFNIRFWGCSAFLAVCAAGHAQINISYNPIVDPSLYRADYSEGFEEFAPNGGTPLTPTNVGGLAGVSLFGSHAALQYTNDAPGGPTDGANYGIYTNGQWALGGAPYYAQVHGGTQGLGVQSTISAGGPVSITIALTPGQADSYFGGYFQSATLPGDPNGVFGSGTVTFDFYNGKTEFLDTTVNPASDWSVFTDPSAEQGALKGIGFAFTGGQTFTSVEISGTALYMDDLQIAQTPALVPEPASFAPLGFGLLMVLRRRKRS